MMGYLIQMTCIYVCALLCFYHFEFYELVYYNVKRYEYWCTVRDIRLSKCSFITIILLKDTLREILRVCNECSKLCFYILRMKDYLQGIGVESFHSLT